MSAWRIAALLGVAFVAIALAFGRIPGMDACGTGGDAILAFEFVTTPDDVARLFPESCRAAHVEAQTRGLWLDALGFIPVYTSFLVVVLGALGRELGGGRLRLARAAMAGTVLAALCDEFEGVQLFHLLGSLPGDQATIDLLMPAVRAKFVLLGVAVAVIGGLLLAQAGWRRLAGALAMLASLVSIAGVFANRELLAVGQVGWLTVLVVVLANALGRRAPVAAAS